MTCASVLSFRRPFRIRQHYGIADDLVTEFLTRMSGGSAHWTILAATACHVFRPTGAACAGIFSILFPVSWCWGGPPSTVFAKGEEQSSNRGLHQRGVNRVILDSRPVHAAR